MRVVQDRVFVAIVTLALTALGATPSVTRARASTPVADIGAAPVLLFAAPGLREDLIETFVADGALPAMGEMLEGGATAEGGLAVPFPATNGPGLTTLLTGTWPAEHGVVADRFFRTGSPEFADWTGWDETGLVQADTLPQAVERAEKQVVAVGWKGLMALDPALSGPIVGDSVPLSQSGVLVNFDLPDQPGRAERAGASYSRIDLEPALDWMNAPESYSPAQETKLVVPSLDASGPNPDRSFEVYIYDATDDAITNYDHVILAVEKDAATAAAELEAGEWSSIGVSLVGGQEGQTAGFWIKAIELTPDLSRFHLYFSPVSRIAASWSGCTDRPLCSASGGFEAAVNQMIGAPMALHPGVLEAGLIDEAVFAEQAITAGWQAVDTLRFVLEDLDVQPDLLLIGTEIPEIMSTQLLGFVLDEETGGLRTGAVDPKTQFARESMLRESYMAADALLAAGQELMGSGSTTFVVSPTSLVPSALAVNAGQVLVDAGFAEVGQVENCVPGPVTAPSGTPDPEALPFGPGVKACWSGGLAHVYINLDGREAAGSVAEEEYESLRDGVVEAFEGLKHQANPGAQVVAGVFRKEDLRDVGGADALHPSRAGDVVVALAPGYRFDDTVGETAIGNAATRAATGYLPQEGAGDGLFLASGPAIAGGAAVRTRAPDIAPTAAFLLGVPGPFNASGRILFNLLADGSRLREVTLLDISDFHGQLTPLSAPADDIEAEGALNDTYGVGGAAVLDAWFDRYRAEALGEVILVTAGDAVGATPPISSVFGDVPTIEAMNMLGFTADSLGNHNFDAGAHYMFGTLALAADFPYLSVNLVPERADAATPEPGDEPFARSMETGASGVRVGLIGFSNPDIPQLTRPGALGPYRVVDPAPAINEEAAILRGSGAEVVIAIGHMGATGGTLTEPTGRVVEVVDQLDGVDVVVGDHTDVQVSALRPSGTLLVENRSKGVMFTRVRIVVDDQSDVVYRTADHHRPWTVGMTLDAEIAGILDALETQLAPILGVVIGEAAQSIPRADSCGMETGRTCESLIGNIITDAMRLTYGTDFALTNSGGIRADLTCPLEGDEFCPADGEGLAITEGRVLTVLPFGNVVVTLSVTGADLKTMLETGVARMPEPSGAFPQVSGLCFTYDLAEEPGNRVTGAVRQATDGTCTGEAIDFTERSTYTLATNDFTASGGDGYPDVLARADTRNILADVVAGFISGESPLALPGEPLDPQLERRIVCEGEGCPAAAGGRS